MYFQRFFLMAYVGLMLTLSACGHLASPSLSPQGDLRTASDQSEPERRARVRLELSAAYFARGQLETALDEVKQALMIYPSMADAWNLRGLIYAGLRESRLAEDSFDQALSLNPMDGNTWHNKGWFYCQLSRFGEADQSFVRALAIPQYRDTSKTWLAQGVCQANAGQLAQSVQTLENAYAREPDNPAFAVNLADVLLRQGGAERAAFYIRRVNQQPAWVDPQTLWLGIRAERKLGQQEAAQSLVRTLKSRFPQSREALAAEQGRFDD